VSQAKRCLVPFPAAPRFHGGRLYSADLNPIEMAFSKLKAHLRTAAARSFDALWRIIGDICELFSRDECWNYLKEAGYASD
jgi:transposase